MDGAPKQEIQDSRHQGIAKVTVQPRHGARPDAAPESIAHDQVVSLPQTLDEELHMTEVIRVVGVAHNDESAVSSRNSCLQGVTISASFHLNDPGPMRPGNLGGAVRTSVVSDDYLALDFGPPQGLPGFVHTTANSACFVQTGHDYGDFGVAQGFLFAQSW